MSAKHPPAKQDGFISGLPQRSYLYKTNYSSANETSDQDYSNYTFNFKRSKIGNKHVSIDEELF